MTNNAKAGKAQLRLSEFRTKVEEAEEDRISCGNEPAAQGAPENQKQSLKEVIDGIRAKRRKNGRATVQEILEWRDEGRR
jgi:hypothetical protein